MSRMPPIFSGGRALRVAYVAAFALGQALAAGVAAFATRDVFAALRGDNVQAAYLPITLIALSGLAIAVCRIAERVVAEKAGQDYAADLREKLFLHLSRMSARDVSERRAGGLALRFVGDLAAVRGWVSLGLARLISASIVLPCAAVVLLALNASLGLAAIAPIILGLTAMSVIGWRLAPAHRRLRTKRAKLAADMSERVPHAPELRLLGRLRTERRNLEKRTAELVDAAIDRARGAGFLHAVPDAAAGLAAASLFWAAFRNGAAPADVAGAMAALGLLVQPMRSLAGVWDKHRAYDAARRKCEALLRAPRMAQSRDKKPARAALSAPAQVKFEDVNAGRVRNLSVVAEPGVRIAIVGANGAGKSTLLSLAAGLEEPSRGKVLISGRNAASLSVKERKAMIAYGGVRSPILAGSLRRAFTMGAAASPDEDAVMGAAVDFGLAGVIKRLGGLDGRVAEGARNLSAGEGRRIMLTRMALSRSRLLLLDEPDDALDADGPRLVKTLLNRTDATALIVTHNPALVRLADEVWFIEDGQLIMSGPPETALAKGPAAGLFRISSVA